MTIQQVGNRSTGGWRFDAIRRLRDGMATRSGRRLTTYKLVVSCTTYMPKVGFVSASLPMAQSCEILRCSDVCNLNIQWFHMIIATSYTEPRARLWHCDARSLTHHRSRRPKNPHGHCPRLLEAQQLTPWRISCRTSLRQGCS